MRIIDYIIRIDNLNDKKYINFILLPLTHYNEYNRVNIIKFHNLSQNT